MQRSVYNWLVDTAGKLPDKVAVHDAGGSYTFSQLRVYSAALGQVISGELDGQIRRPVVVYMENSKEAVASFMSVVYSGNFYVPIDTNMPLSRVHKIFDTLEPELILCRDEKSEQLQDEFTDISVLSVDKYFSDPADAQDDNNALYKVLINEDLLYVLFTSGSTGNPKGVAIPHKGVINYIDWVTDCFSITETDNIGNQAPFYFDNSVLDIYSMLKTGATLYITPHILFSQPVPLLEYIKENEISTIFWVPSALVLVSRLRALRNVDVSGTLKKILFAGEVMPVKQLNYWRKYIPNAVYANLYGPTEITVDCTFFIIDREFTDDESIPIGGPVPNADIIVLDENNGIVVDPETVGELCVKGIGLAAGYYNNPEKTKEVFVQNPANWSYPEKIYRTGDLVKYNERGELVYVTRKDFQIKHMGHRIELGEIETAVSSFDGISMSCCLYDEKKGKIVLFLETEIAKGEINQRLRDFLPDYMLPGKVVHLEKLPLNANGKIDRVKLKEYLM